MATENRRAIRVLRIKKTDDLKTIYAKVKRSFSAADLQRYTENDEMLPAADLLKAIKAIHRDEQQKMRKSNIKLNTGKKRTKG